MFVYVGNKDFLIFNSRGIFYWISSMAYGKLLQFRLILLQFQYIDWSNDEVWKGKGIVKLFNGYYITSKIR